MSLDTIIQKQKKICIQKFTCPIAILKHTQSPISSSLCSKNKQYFWLWPQFCFLGLFLHGSWLRPESSFIFHKKHSMFVAEWLSHHMCCLCKDGDPKTSFYFCTFVIVVQIGSALFHQFSQKLGGFSKNFISVNSIRQDLHPQILSRQSVLCMP